MVAPLGGVGNIFLSESRINTDKGITRIKKQDDKIFKPRRCGMCDVKRET